VLNPGVYTGGREAWQSELEKYKMSPEDWEKMMRSDVTTYWEAAEEYFEMPLPDFIKNDAVGKLGALADTGEGRRPLNMMTILGGSLPRARVLSARSELHRTVIDAELALARYRLKHGRYPDKVDEVKNLMLTDGIDPFSGKPLLYRLEDDGSFTIWSVGENLVDDGGVPETDNPWPGDDHVWNSRLLSTGN